MRIHEYAEIRFGEGTEFAPPGHCDPRDLLALLEEAASNGGAVLLRGLEIEPGVILTSALVSTRRLAGVVVIFDGDSECRFDTDGRLIDRVPGGLAPWRRAVQNDDLSWAKEEEEA